MFINIFILLATALLSLVSVPIGNSDFRITLGIVVFIAFVYILKFKRPILFSFVAGLVVCITRILFDSMSIKINGTLASNYLLETFFYLGYGIIYYLAVVSSKSAYPLPLVVSLAISDAGANTIEYIIRHIAADEVYENTSFYTILIAAFVRSVLIVLLIWILERFVYSKSSHKEA